MPTGIDTPWALPCQLGTHQYALDPKKFSRQDLPALRQTVSSNGSGDADTLSLEGSWSRGATDWTLGAGQETYDSATSDPRRYGKHSLTQPIRLGRFQLAPALQSRSTTRGSYASGMAVRCGVYIYFIESSGVGNGTVRAFDSNGGPYVAITVNTTLTPPSLMQFIASDGLGTVWATTLSDGIYRTTSGASGGTLTSWSSSSAFDAMRLGYANGRLLGATTNVIYEIDSTPALTTIHTFPTGVQIYQFLGTPGAIYVFTNNGIYVMDDVDPTGALSPPRVAAVLGLGETIQTAVVANGSVLVIATSIGVRLAVINGDGSLTIGDPLFIRIDPATQPNASIQSLAVVNQYVYVVYYQTSATLYSLARIDLSNFTASLAPALHPLEAVSSSTSEVWTNVVAAGLYGGDVWVLGYDTGNGRIYGFTPSELLPDYFASAKQKVSSGNLYSGWITLGIAELKQPVVVNVIHEALPTGASIKVTLVKDDGTETDLGTQSTAATTFTTFSVDSATIGPQRKFQIKLTLTRGTTDTQSPVVESWTVRAMPIPQRQEEILLSIMMQPVVEMGDDGNRLAQDLASEYTYLAGLRDARTPVTVTVLGRSDTVVVDRVAWPQGEVEKIANGRDEFVGTLYVRLLTVA